MVDPQVMCDKHLLGEHVELHMFIGTIKKGIRVDGYIKNDLLEIQSIYSKHDDLIKEMNKRGMKHKSPLQLIDISNVKKITIPRGWSKHQLISRCNECKKRNKP